MAIVGPGAQPTQQIDAPPLLDGASEYEYVTVYNPLSDDFAVRVAQDVPINLPFNIGRDTSGKVTQLTNTDQDARQVYGLSLKNPDFQGRRHIISDTIIKAGQTINLKGNEAQVAVRQLVNEILQRQGKTRLSADPTLRREIEQEIVLSRGSVQELMDRTVQTPRQQIDSAINQSNEVINAPQEEPADGPRVPGPTDSSQAAGATASPVKFVGRPRRSPQTTRKTDTAG